MESINLISSTYSDDDDYATSPHSQEEEVVATGVVVTESQPRLATVEEPVKDSVDGRKDNNHIVEICFPPPPKAKCSDKLQEKIKTFLNHKRNGYFFNAKLRSSKEYRNSNFLQHAVTYQGIDEIGSCLSKEIFDPHGYDKSDFYDEIVKFLAPNKAYQFPFSKTEAVMKREMEQKEQERKKIQKVDSISERGTQSRCIPIPAGGCGLRAVAAVDSKTRNKKSKWDKMGDDETIRELIQNL